MKKSIVLLLVVWIAACSSFVEPIQAQPGIGGAIVLGAIGDKIGSSLISDAQNAAQNLLNDFDTDANALSARLASQLGVAAQTAVLLAGSELNKAVKDMSVPIQQLMVNLDKLTQSINSLRSSAFELKDAFVLDIRSLTQNVPFVGENFYIQRIDGVLQLRKDTPYVITVLGVGLGPQSEKHETTSIGLKICKGPMPADCGVLGDTSVDQTAANTAELTIPPTDLNGLFVAKPVRVKVSLEIDQRTKKPLGWKSEHYSIPFNLVLMPLDAGTVNVTFTVHTFDWKDTKNRDQNILTTPDMDQKKAYATNDLSLTIAGTGHQPPTVGDQKYCTATTIAQGYCSDPIRFDCIGGQDQSCAFKIIDFVEPVNGDRSIAAHWRTNSHPTTWRLSADILQWGETADKELPQVSYQIQYGSTFSIPLPADYELVHLTGTTVTGEKIDLYYPEGSTLLTSVAMPTGATTVVYRVNRPDGN